MPRQWNRPCRHRVCVAARLRDVGTKRSGAARTARFSRTRPARPHSHGDARRSCNQDRQCWANWRDGRATGPFLRRIAPPDRPSARRIASQRRTAAGVAKSLPYRLRRRNQGVRVTRCACRRMHAYRRRSRGRARNPGRSRPASNSSRKPAAQRVQIHEAAHRGVAKRVPGSRSRHHRCRGSLRRPSTRNPRRAVPAVQARRPESCWCRARAVHLPAQRRGKRWSTQSPRYPGLRVRFHDRLASSPSAPASSPPCWPRRWRRPTSGSPAAGCC